MTHTTSIIMALVAVGLLHLIVGSVTQRRLQRVRVGAPLTLQHIRRCRIYVVVVRLSGLVYLGIAAGIAMGLGR